MINPTLKKHFIIWMAMIPVILLYPPPSQAMEMTPEQEAASILTREKVMEELHPETPCTSADMNKIQKHTKMANSHNKEIVKSNKIIASYDGEKMPLETINTEMQKRAQHVAFFQSAEHVAMKPIYHNCNVAIPYQTPIHYEPASDEPFNNTEPPDPENEEGDTSDEPK